MRQKPGLGGGRDQRTSERRLTTPTAGELGELCSVVEGAARRRRGSSWEALPSQSRRFDLVPSRQFRV